MSAHRHTLFEVTTAGLNLTPGGIRTTVEEKRTYCITCPYEVTEKMEEAQ